MELGGSALLAPPGPCDLVAGSLWREFELWGQIELGSNPDSTTFRLCDAGPATSLSEPWLSTASSDMHLKRPGFPASRSPQAHPTVLTQLPVLQVHGQFLWEGCRENIMVSHPKEGVVPATRGP